MLLLLSLPPVVVFATAVVFADDVIAAAAVLVCACPLPGRAHSAFVHGHFGVFGLVRFLFVLIWVVGACPASRLCLC